MKVTTSDLLAILRRFDVADESHVPRNIEQVVSRHPSPINQLVSFKFAKHFYYALFDEIAEDDTQYIIDEIKKVRSETTGEILKNPTSDIMTHGLPFKGKDVYLFRLVSGKKRLDVLLAERYPDYSRNTWQKLIKAGSVCVNKVVVTSPKTDVTDADDIAVSYPEIPDHSELVLPIIYLDDHVIVVDKPVGVLTHSKGALSDEFTVADFFRRYTTVGLDTNRPGIVHRLDRDTSGVIIGARTPESYDLLKAQFADRKAKKTYRAVVDGKPAERRAVIELPIARNPKSPSTFRVDANGKSATTTYEVISENETYSLVDLKPTTGRTHQLRVHMAYLGTPIHGDRVYGKPADRLYLHAASLEITTPTSKRTTFSSDTPPVFADLVRISR